MGQFGSYCHHLGVKIMKTEIQPEYPQVNITCACGTVIKTRSTTGKNFTVEICSACHPFFTGKQKLIDSAGRVDRFRKQYAKTPPAKKTNKH